MTPLIKLKGITKIYPMGEVEVHALDDVDLFIKKGEFVAITGPSGSATNCIR